MSTPRARSLMRPSLNRLREMAELRGGECLSDRYANLETPMRWRCQRNHIWEMLARRIWEGDWCPNCRGRPSYTIENMQGLAAEHGGRCLSRKYTNAETKLRWRCKKGHEWEATPTSVRKGKWCEGCRRDGRLDQFRRLAAERGGRCLSEEYKGLDTRLRWRCGKGHEWETTPRPIQRGTWCPHCDGQVRTIGDMRAAAKARGGRCLSKTYINSKTKLRWRCEKGHEWETTPMGVQAGNWCPYCQGRHKTIADMRALAKERGGRCMSTRYVSAKTKLRWRCKKGHEWEAMPRSVQSGNWCPHCRGLHKTIGDMQELAQKRGGLCLSRKYKHSKSKLRWRCDKGHEWDAAPGNVQAGGWCPHCQGKHKTIADMRALAKARGGRCMSAEYVTSVTKLRWRCSKGHEWDAIPGNVRSGQWCPRCQGKHKTIDDMRALAKARGGHCLSNEYINSTTKLRWRCAEGHEWAATPAGVQAGHWCRPCSRQPLESVTKAAKLSWRCEKGHAWEGRPNRVQQAPQCPYCLGRRKTIEDMHALARAREGRCLSREYVTGTTKLSWCCAKGHAWEATPQSVQKGSWCPYCLGRHKTIEGMQALAQARGGRCLTRNYTNSQSKLRWRCTNGHEWEATPSMVQYGTWCPYCRGYHKTIEDMRVLAQARGGLCLSREYTNSSIKLRWRCAKGHEWEAIPYSVRNGSWCAYCYGRHKTIGDMQSLAETRGGRCLSVKYTNNRTKLRWRCSKGHEWESAPMKVRQGRWCPYCRGRKQPEGVKQPIRNGVRSVGFGADLGVDGASPAPD